MPKGESLSGNKFFDSYIEAISTPKNYCPTTQSKKLVTSAPEFFIDSRIKSLKQILFTENNDSYEMCAAFLSEYMVYLCLEEPLRNVGLVTDLAPFEIENGHSDGRGVDIVISSFNQPRKQRIPLLGINVKMRKAKPSQISESHAYESRLKAPYITVSLGSWSIQTREEKKVFIREWMDQLAIPNIHTSGKLPYFSQLRDHVFMKTEQTLYDYLYKVLSHIHSDYVPNESQIRLFPTNKKELIILRDKLLTIHSTFAEVRMHL